MSELEDMEEDKDLDPEADPNRKILKITNIEEFYLAEKQGMVKDKWTMTIAEFLEFFNTVENKIEIMKKVGVKTIVASDIESLVKLADMMEAENGDEKYKLDPIFRQTIDYLCLGGAPEKIINNLIDIINSQQKEIERLSK